MTLENEIIFIKFKAYGSGQLLNRGHCGRRGKKNSRERRRGWGRRHESKKLTHDTMLIGERMSGRHRERKE